MNHNEKVSLDFDAEMAKVRQEIIDRCSSQAEREIFLIWEEAMDAAKDSMINFQIAQLFKYVIAKAYLKGRADEKAAKS